MGGTGGGVSVGWGVPDLCPVGEGVSAPVVELVEGNFGVGDVCPHLGMAGGMVAAGGGVAAAGLGVEWHFGDWGGGYGVFCGFEFPGGATDAPDGYPVAHVGDAVGLGDPGGRYSIGAIGGHGADGDGGGGGGDGTPGECAGAVSPVAGAGVGGNFCPVPGGGGGAVPLGIGGFSGHAPVEYDDSPVGGGVGAGLGGDSPGVSSGLAGNCSATELAVGFGGNGVFEYLCGDLVATNGLEMGTGGDCPNPEQYQSPVCPAVSVLGGGTGEQAGLVGGGGGVNGLLVPVSGVDGISTNMAITLAL